MRGTGIGKKIKMTDEKLIEKICREDKELYAQIVKKYQEKLLRYATHLIGDKYKASEIIQESFIKAYINLRSFNINKKFSSWIYRIVHNEAMSYFQKYKKEIPIKEEMNLSSGQNIEEDFSKKEIVEKAHKCLRKISIIYSEPLALFYLDEKSYEEISDILRIPMGTVAIRISRAKVIMKKICEQKK